MQKSTWMLTTFICVMAFTTGCNNQSVWQAAATGDQDHVNWKLFWHRKLINERDSEKQWTPLQHAIANSYGDMAALLLRKGADPNVTSWDGRNARAFAADVPNDFMRQFIFDAIEQAETQRLDQAEAEQERPDDIHLHEAEPSAPSQAQQADADTWQSE